MRRFLQHDEAVVPESRSMSFSTDLTTLSRDDILELPPYYLTSIADHEKYGTRDCVARFELADRIQSRGVVAVKDGVDESGMGFVGIKRDDTGIKFDDDFSAATPQPITQSM